MTWIARNVLVLLLVSFLAAPASAVPIVQDTFDADVEGWTAIIIDGAITLSTVSFAAGAGNPGGAVRHDAPTDGRVSFFLAPPAIVTGLHSAVGGSLSWDLATISHAGDVFFPSAITDVNIRAGSDRLRLNVTPPPPATHPIYTHYDAPFDLSAGWLVFNGTTTTTATQDQIDSVIAGADSLIIRAEYFSGPTADVAFLDNVALNPSPEPGTWLLLGSSFVLVGRRLFRKPHGT